MQVCARVRLSKSTEAHQPRGTFGVSSPHALISGRAWALSFEAQVMHSVTHRLSGAAGSVRSRSSARVDAVLGGNGHLLVKPPHQIVEGNHASHLVHLAAEHQSAPEHGAQGKVLLGVSRLP